MNKIQKAFIEYGLSGAKRGDIDRFLTDKLYGQRVTIGVGLKNAKGRRTQLVITVKSVMNAGFAGIQISGTTVDGSWRSGNFEFNGTQL